MFSWLSNLNGMCDSVIAAESAAFKISPVCRRKILEMGSCRLYVLAYDRPCLRGEYRRIFKFERKMITAAATCSANTYEDELMANLENAIAEVELYRWRSASIEYMKKEFEYEVRRRQLIYDLSVWKLIRIFHLAVGDVYWIQMSSAAMF